jgi:osmotically-inducible protein OsmY
MRSYEDYASEIGVKVDNGFVTLEGKVSSRDEKRAAEMEVEDLPGVLDIRNELKIDRNARDSGAAQAVKNDLGL